MSDEFLIATSASVRLVVFVLGCWVLLRPTNAVRTRGRTAVADLADLGWGFKTGVIIAWAILVNLDIILWRHFP